MKFRELNHEEWKILKNFEKEFGIDLRRIFPEKIFLISSGRKEIFIVDDFVYKIYNKINREIYSIGLYIGEIRGKYFLISLELASMIEPFTNNKIVVNEKAEQLFLYGRDIFKESIVKEYKRFKLGERCLVLNKRHEVLGIGKYERNIVKNLMDRGWYLRRGG